MTNQDGSLVYAEGFLADCHALFDEDREVHQNVHLYSSAGHKVNTDMATRKIRC